MIYLDSSALVKLVVPESESAALFEFLADRPARVSSALSRVEVHRALKRAGCSKQQIARGDQVLNAISLMRIDDAILDAASRLAPSTLRSLDAIHLATALAVGEDLDAVVAYDDRLAGAAKRAGLRSLAPT